MRRLSLNPEIHLSLLRVPRAAIRVPRPRFGLTRANVLALVAAVWVSLVSHSESCSQVDVTPEVLDAQQRRVEVIRRASAATISVLAPGGNGGGSGVVVTPDGYALTNFHVVQGNGSHMQCTMPDGMLYDSVLVGIDPVGDVALIKLSGRDDFPVAEIADSDEVRAGQRCFAVGNPFILATNFQPTVTTGIISGVHRYQYPSGTLLEYADCIQTDAAINPGNSGGPLFDEVGRLIGINGRGSFEKRGRVNVGVGYAISINQIRLFFDHLLSGRIVDHATLGATVGTSDIGEVRVTNILETSDAYFQGLRFDDRIVAFAGRDITSVNQFKNLLGIFPRDWRVPLKFERDGQVSEIIVRLSGVHSEIELIELTSGSTQSVTEQLDAEIEDDFEQRTGFANYHFNRLKLQEIYEQSLLNEDFSTARGAWHLSGIDDNGNEISIVLGDEQSGMQSGENTWLYTPGDATSSPPDSPESRAIMGLHQWRIMLNGGPQNFGNTIYFGSLPVSTVSETADVDGNIALTVSLDGRTADVLKSTRGISESFFYFEPATRHLLAIDLFPDVDVPASEIHFSDYQIHDELSVPSTIDLITPGFPAQRLNVRRIEFTPHAPEGDE